MSCRFSGAENHFRVNMPTIICSLSVSYASKWISCTTMKRATRFSEMFSNRFYLATSLSHLLFSFLSIPLCFLRVENIFAKNTFNVSDTSRGMAFRGKRIFIACFSASIDFTISSNFDGNKHIRRTIFA